MPQVCTAQLLTVMCVCRVDDADSGCEDTHCDPAVPHGDKM